MRGRQSPRSAWRACRPLRSLDRASPTSAPGSPAAATSATAATRRLHSCSPERSPTPGPRRDRRAAAPRPNEFLDRWRVPGEDASHVWEERFGEHAYVPLAGDRDQRRPEVIWCHAERARLRASSAVSTAARVRRVAASIGARPEAIVDDLTARDRQHRHRAVRKPAPRRRARPGRARTDDPRR